MKDDASVKNYKFDQPISRQTFVIGALLYFAEGYPAKQVTQVDTLAQN